VLISGSLIVPDGEYNGGWRKGDAVGFIKVTPDELRTQASQVAQGASEVEGLLQKLLGQVHDLAGRWEGAGSSSFQQLYEEWSKGAEMTKQGMDGISKFLNDAAQQYEDTDTAVASAGQ
jgi:WXG100 family type VII secretion target